MADIRVQIQQIKHAATSGGQNKKGNYEVFTPAESFSHGVPSKGK